MSDTTTDHAAPFREQANQIDRNAGGNFAGAFVIVAPDGTVEATLLLDASPSLATFWSIIATKASIAIAEAEADARQGAAGFGGRR